MRGNAWSSIYYDFKDGVARAIGSRKKDISGAAVAYAGEATLDCGIGAIISL